MAESVRMYEPLHGRVPPGALFAVRKDGPVFMDFSYQAVELFGLGTEFRSANLYHVRDSELDSERIMLELFPDAKKGQRRLTLCDARRRARIYVTAFIAQFELPFKVHHRYPAWVTGSSLYVDLDG